MRIPSACVLLSFALVACSSPCPSGTVASGGACVSLDSGAAQRDALADALPDRDEPVDGAMDAMLAMDAIAAMDARADGAPQDALDGSMADGAARDTGVRDAGGPPTFPSTIRHLSVAIRTGNEPNAGGGDDPNPALELCLNATTCFPLDVPSIDDFRRGEMDVYHFTGVGLPRSEVDRVELRWRSGNDSVHPACVQVQFDGEPVHCRDGITTFLGDGAGEARSWRDPRPLSETCTTCFASRVTHGPLVGAIEPNSARILVRTDSTRPVSLEVQPAGGGAARRIGPVYPDPDDDFTAVFDVDGLSPRTQYTASAVLGGARVGRVARFRTAPRAGVATRFQMGFGSCANDTNFPVQPIFGEIDSRDLDLFMFIGDNHYGNTRNLQAHWWRYRNAMDMPARAAMLAHTPVVATWDDHDYCGNNTDRTCDAKETVLRAFSDYWANPSFGLPATPGVFFQTAYGDVDFFVLDARYYRENEATGDSVLGDAQEAWLFQALRRSTATFRVIVSGSTFSRGAGETWWHYPQRQRLFDVIRNNNIGGVVFLAGDIHRSHFRWIHRTHYDIPELVSSGLAVHQEGTCPGPDAVEPDAHQVACTQEAPTFMQLDFDTTAGDPTLLARMIDGAGRTLHQMTIRRSQLR